MFLTLACDSGISCLPAEVITGSSVVSHFGLGHFCDTSDGTAELQKRSNMALAKKLVARKCDRCLNESPLHITVIYYEI